MRVATAEDVRPRPKRYMSFVIAASEVMSCPDMTPALASLSPATYLRWCTPPLTHCVTLTITIPLAIAWAISSMNHPEVGAFPAPYVRRTIPLIPGVFS